MKREILIALAYSIGLIALWFLIFHLIGGIPE